MKVTERFVSDNYWWSVLTYLEKNGQPYNPAVHSVVIAYQPPKNFCKKDLKDQQAFCGRHKFFCFKKWEHELEPPTSAQLLELEVEDVVALRVKHQAETYSRTDRYWALLFTQFSEVLKKAGLLDPEWSEPEEFNKYVRKCLRAEEAIEEVAKEWQEATREQQEEQQSSTDSGNETTSTSSDSSEGGEANGASLAPDLEEGPSTTSEPTTDTPTSESSTTASGSGEEVVEVANPLLSATRRVKVKLGQ